MLIGLFFKAFVKGAKKAYRTHKEGCKKAAPQLVLRGGDLSATFGHRSGVY